MTIPTGLVKSTIHDPGAASSRARRAMSSTTGTVRSALPKPPAPVVSWPMHPQASGTVSSDSRAACPPTRIWMSTTSAPSTRAIEVAGERQRPVEALAREHALGQAADHLQALRVDVVEHELAHVEARALAREPGHQLGRVGRAGADDRDLHPFTPVSVTPSTKAFCAAKNSAMTGAMKRIVAIIVRFHSTWYWVRN